MNSFNKITTRYGLLMLAIAIVAFATIMVAYGFIKSGVFWPAIIPVVVAVVYGCIAFFNKYKPNEQY
jgi:CHASE2 domain-containing sensor protein